MAILLGCGSWADPEYAGILYERGTPPTGRLAAYARSFSTVEVNSSYYATPRREIVDSWVKKTPPGFLFDVKLHRAFSRNPEKTARDGKLLSYLLEGVKPLLAARKLGCFLLVLSADFNPSGHRLEELDPLVEALRPHLLAIELRHRDWVTPPTRESTLRFFQERAIVWVATDLPRLVDSSLMPVMDEVTSPELAYLRLHGRNPHYLEAKTAAEGHAYEYSKPELNALIRRIEKLAALATNVHVFANNHANDFAPRAALALQTLLANRDTQPARAKRVSSR